MSPSTSKSQNAEVLDRLAAVIRYLRTAVGPDDPMLHQLEIRWEQMQQDAPARYSLQVGSARSGMLPCSQ